MRKRNTLHPAPDVRRLRLRDKIKILSRRDRMGKAMPTWYRVLAVVLIIIAGLILINHFHRKDLDSRVVAPEPLTKGSSRLVFTGDLSLDGNIDVIGEMEGYSTLFSAVSPLWEDSSFVFTCMDGVVLPEDHEGYPAEETAENPCIVKKEALSAAAQAGLNAFSLANDHVLDFGSAGLQQTVLAMESLGLNYAGAGENLPAAGECRILEADGIRVGFIACSAINPNGPGPIDDYSLTTTAYSGLYRNILLASDETDLLVVYVCWGDQDGIAVSEAQQKVAHQLIDSGADIVIGTHPHVLQPIEQYQNGWIFYSLGDLVSDGYQRAERESVLVRLDFDAQAGTGTFTLIPLLLEDFCPAPVENGFYVSQIQQSLLRDLDSDSYSIEENGRITIPMTVSPQ